MQATCHFILLFLFLPSDIPRRQSACSCPLSDALFNLFVRASDLKEERAMCKRSHKGKAVVGASINYTAQSPRPSVNLQPTVFQCLNLLNRDWGIGRTPSYACTGPHSALVLCRFLVQKSKSFVLAAGLCMQPTACTTPFARVDMTRAT